MYTYKNIFKTNMILYCVYVRPTAFKLLTIVNDAFINRLY